MTAWTWLPRHQHRHRRLLRHVHSAGFCRVFFALCWVENGAQHSVSICDGDGGDVHELHRHRPWWRRSWHHHGCRRHYCRPSKWQRLSMSRRRAGRRRLHSCRPNCSNTVPAAAAKWLFSKQLPPLLHGGRGVKSCADCAQSDCIDWAGCVQRLTSPSRQRNQSAPVGRPVHNVIKLTVAIIAPTIVEYR